MFRKWDVEVNIKITFQETHIVWLQQAEEPKKNAVESTLASGTATVRGTMNKIAQIILVPPIGDNLWK